MTSLLAIDTSSALCSVALLHNGSCSSKQSGQPRQAAQQILPMIQQLLDASEIGLRQLDAIGVISGPGSFTGLRIGIGVVQGLSMANNTAVIPISALAVMAMAACRQSPGEQWLVAQVARETEIYIGAYRRDSAAGVVLLGQELAIDVSNATQLKKLGDQLPGSWHGVGDGWINLRESIEAGLGVGLESCLVDPGVEVGDLCELAQIRLDRGDVVESGQLLPNYVKDQLDYS
jgi:tRNA threonylcarbamoyladenosine biosynthesis protein TsaB